MGGRIAEEIFLGRHHDRALRTTSRRATELARAMVCEYGMSDLGPLTFGKKEEQIFLGREIAQHRDYSEDTAIKIDQEVKRIVMEQYDRARQIIADNREAMDRLAEALLERESLDRSRFAGWSPACRSTTRTMRLLRRRRPRSRRGRRLRSSNRSFLRSATPRRKGNDRITGFLELIL